jgi:hypothetical protein
VVQVEPVEVRQAFPLPEVPLAVELPEALAQALRTQRQVRHTTMLERE